MGDKKLSSGQQKVVDVASGILTGSTFGCLVGGSVLIALVMIIALIRLLAWLLGL